MIVLRREDEPRSDACLSQEWSAASPAARASRLTGSNIGKARFRSCPQVQHDRRASRRCGDTRSRCRDPRRAATGGRRIGFSSIRSRIVRNRSKVNSIGRTRAFLSYIAELHRAVHAVGLFSRCAPRRRGLAAGGARHHAPRAWAGPTINDVHRAFLHRRSTLTSVLDRLENKAMIRRTRPRMTGVASGLELTARGFAPPNRSRASSRRCASTWNRR